ncbi:MAG: hypothetical protein ABIW19_08375 [Vicinamibacterales bacterium]
MRSVHEVPFPFRPNTIRADFSARSPDRGVTTQWFAGLEVGGHPTDSLVASVDAVFTAIESKSIEPREGLPGRAGIATMTVAAVEYLREFRIHVGYLELLKEANDAMPFGIRQSFLPVMSALMLIHEALGK